MFEINNKQKVIWSTQAFQMGSYEMKDKKMLILKINTTRKLESILQYSIRVMMCWQNRAKSKFSWITFLFFHQLLIFMFFKYFSEENIKISHFQQELMMMLKANEKYFLFKFYESEENYWKLQLTWGKRFTSQNALITTWNILGTTNPRFIVIQMEQSNYFKYFSVKFINSISQTLNHFLLFEFSGRIILKVLRNNHNKNLNVYLWDQQNSIIIAWISILSTPSKAPSDGKHLNYIKKTHQQEASEVKREKENRFGYKLKKLNFNINFWHTFTLLLSYYCKQHSVFIYIQFRKIKSLNLQ